MNIFNYFKSGDLIFLEVLLILVILISFAEFCLSKSLKNTIATFIVGVIIICGIGGIFYWINAHPATDIQPVKNCQLEFNNGVEQRNNYYQGGKINEYVYSLWSRR